MTYMTFSFLICKMMTLLLCYSATLNQMMTAVLGFYSPRMDVQKRVEKSMKCLIPYLLCLLQKCPANQAVIKAMSYGPRRGRRERI
mmetsp:Transcript_38930/g.99801  ORF Transcript_38930/g.99801 Transcript_38930/m.99801 type:complete len:86 (-) Transcript_38930:225-482(-)